MSRASERAPSLAELGRNPRDSFEQAVTSQEFAPRGHMPTLSGVAPPAPIVAPRRSSGSLPAVDPTEHRIEAADLGAPPDSTVRPMTTPRPALSPLTPLSKVASKVAASPTPAPTLVDATVQRAPHVTLDAVSLNEPHAERAGLSRWLLLLLLGGGAALYAGFHFRAHAAAPAAPAQAAAVPAVVAPVVAPAAAPSALPVVNSAPDAEQAPPAAMAPAAPRGTHHPAKKPTHPSKPAHKPASTHHA